MESAAASRLTGTELIAFGKRAVTDRLETLGCTVTAPTNPRDGKLDVRTTSGRRLEVFVSTQRVGGYAFWTKRRLQPASHRTVMVVLLDATTSPLLYVVPTSAWDAAVPPLTDRDYEGKGSEPEFGIELHSAAVGALARYAWSDRMAKEHFR